MPSTDSIQAYGIWLVAVVLVIAFLLVWINFQRKPRRSKTLSVSEIKLVRDLLEKEQERVIDDDQATEHRARWRLLSSRQQQVCLLAARDLSDEEIARELDVSIATVKTHLREAYRKLGVHSRHDLQYVVQHLASGPH